MQRARFVDDLLDARLGRAKSKPTKNPTDLSISGDVDREVICKLYFEIPRQDIGCHSRDLCANSVELKKAINDLSTRRAAGPDKGGIAFVMACYALYTSVKQAAHRIYKAVQWCRLGQQIEDILSRESRKLVD